LLNDLKTYMLLLLLLEMLLELLLLLLLRGVLHMHEREQLIEGGHVLCGLVAGGGGMGGGWGGGTVGGGRTHVSLQFGNSRDAGGCSREMGGLGVTAAASPKDRAAHGRVVASIPRAVHERQLPLLVLAQLGHGGGVVVGWLMLLLLGVVVHEVGF
jgi:hypothetical protein